MAQGAGRGFREVDHTADWELEVWGPDFGALAEEAIAGMMKLLQLSPARGRRVDRRLAVTGTDREDLLVALLSEILYVAESEALVFDRITVREDSGGLVAEGTCRALVGPGPDIKAVTYHRLEVRDTAGGLAANVVFDV